LTICYYTVANIQYKIKNKLKTFTPITLSRKRQSGSETVNMFIFIRTISYKNGMLQQICNVNIMLFCP